MSNSETKYASAAVPVYGEVALEERFVTPVVDTTLDAQPYLEVAAPATLPEGYTFDAEADGHSFTVKVPVGGVEEGQKFSVPFSVPAGSNDYSGMAVPRISVPVGHWKDGLCDCFIHGCCHPMVWNAYCCPMIAVGQVMHRLKLTWWGDRGDNSAQTTSTFRVLFWVTMAFIAIRCMLGFAIGGLIASASQTYEPYGDSNMEALNVMYKLSVYPYALFLIYIIAKTRSHIRNKYSIPEQCCAGEDCCCAFWCTCCTVSQMARHTGDYEHYAAQCCSETGLAPNAPSIV